ncbi:TrmH family RNA methyltransferase [Sphingobacterium puteale]|uniref:TrmH family RNA methyltransferase n=1 Tax=Sphingobacterium puteale TaxID=2420510 RepID=A0A420VSR1_9SPHI|nr:RNA methyltransferase [Sphingobacterium puteale]RKO69315.1 TrmH family RNA methyltransferase [Sphingobacterium puteale]
MQKLSMDELQRTDVESFKKQEKTPIAIVLDNVRSMHNVGSAFRTADGFAIEKIYLCGITGTPPHREIEKTALGATQSVSWEYHKETIDVVAQLKMEGYTIIAIEQADDSVMLHQFEPKSDKKYALIFGNEVNGVDEEVMEKIDTCIEIPQYGTKHSLNVSVAIGIILWDFIQKRNLN